MIVLALLLASPIQRTIVSRTDIAGTDEELQLILVEIAPGASVPKHQHPVEGLNYIVSGRAESQYEGEPLREYKAGESYVDPANKVHAIFRNPSTVEPLKFLIACKIRKGVSFGQPIP